MKTGKTLTQDIQYIFTRFVHSLIRYNICDGVVKSIDKTKFTCVVTVGNSEFADVPLRVLINSQSSFIEIPKAGTNCLLCFRNMLVSRPQILEIHECDEIIIKIGNSVLNITDGVFKFNNGDNGGIPLANNVANKLNSIETKLNDVLTALKIHTHPVVINTLTATPSANFASILPITPTTQKSDIENTKITQ